MYYGFDYNFRKDTRYKTNKMTDIVTHTQRLHIRLEHLDTLSLSGFFYKPSN